ncbi:Uncharacterised protein [Mycobacteroides abscessus subsp. abscessus]|nr:Uncharacterised protein [Mycobacteroides abscessus subsp. abscessus]
MVFSRVVMVFSFMGVAFFRVLMVFLFMRVSFVFMTVFIRRF